MSDNDATKWVRELFHAAEPAEEETTPPERANVVPNEGDNPTVPNDPMRELVRVLFDD